MFNSAGVPQSGDILSRLLFNIFAFDQYTRSDTLLVDYADDKTVISIYPVTAAAVFFRAIWT